jgi:AcrR family transcriptional regulator
MEATPHRGRPKKGQSEQRRALVLEAAQSELLTHGYEATTMLGIARRCGTSKETLYTWFGSKEGLVRELIAGEGEATVGGVRKALASAEAEPKSALQRFARSLLDLLCGEWSLIVNRAAMASPQLAQLVLANGRYRVGPMIEELLIDLDRRHILRVDDGAVAFRLLYGMIVQDTQIRVLLGEDPPSLIDRHAQADAAVDTFWQLHHEE